VEVDVSLGLMLPIALPLLTIAALLLAREFFDPLSLLLTLGGALMVTCCSYSKAQLRGLAEAIGELFAGLCAPERRTVADHGRELDRLAELFRLQGIRGLENQERHLADGFLRYGVGLLVDWHSQEQIRLRLERELARAGAAAEINRQILTTLGKLLPSFGLIGTLIGMVLLLSRVSALDPKGMPAVLGLALLTTLYGAVCANLLVAPLLARLQSAAVEKEHIMRLTMDWVLTLSRGEAVNIGEPRRVPRRVADGDKLQEWAPGSVPMRR
jgi:chemotaxis protein MotA